MPKMSCLFGAASDAVLQTLSADAVIGPRLHRFAQCVGIRGPGPLAVVLLSGAVAPPWEPEPQAWEAMDSLAAPALAEHAWLAQELPPPGVVARWWAMSRETEQPLAWWWWEEHGDDLYADAMWLFSASAQAFGLRTTALAGGESWSGEGSLFRGGAPEPFNRAPLRLAMEHIGFRSLHEHFLPTDDWHFDWAPLRWSAGAR